MTGGGRFSGIEGLRLLCMLMVLNLHGFSGYTHGEGIWQALDFFRESTSICAVDCFLIISGYFGIRWKFKSFFNLVFQIFFYSIGIYVFAVLLGITELSRQGLLERLECLYNNSWEFVTGYVILYFLSPILNTFADKVTTRELLWYILVMLVATNLICLSDKSNLVFTYMTVYLTGRLLKKIDIVNAKLHASVCYWVVTTLIFISVYVMFKGLGVTSPSKLPVGVVGFAYSAPLVIIQATFLFSIFARMTFSSKAINWSAKSAFAIFLIHMHPSIKMYYYNYAKETL